MDSANAGTLIIFTGESVKYDKIIQFIFVELSFIISPGPDNCFNPFGNNISSACICHSIGSNRLYLFSKHVFLWEYMYILIFIKYNCGIIRFQYNMLWVLYSWWECIKGLFLVWTWGGLFLAFRLGLFYFVLSLLVMHFCISKTYFETLIYLRLNFISLESTCKNRLLNIRMVS